MYCRLCLSKFKTHEFLNLFSYDDGIDWHKLCCEYLRIEIKHEDVFSPFSCRRCSKILKEFHDFFQHAQHCQLLLPQIHSKRYINQFFRDKRNNSRSPEHNEVHIKTERYDSENSSEMPIDVAATLSISSDSPKHNSVLIVRESSEQESESILGMPCPENESKRLRISNEGDETRLIVKTERDEDTGSKVPEVAVNQSSHTQATDEQVRCTFVVKLEPHDNESAETSQEIKWTDTMSAKEMKSIKDEPCFESTEYEMQFLPDVQTNIAEKTPHSKFTIDSKQNEELIERIEERNQEQQTYRKALRQVDDPFDLDEEMFRKIYHLSTDLTQFLIQSLDDQLRGKRITAITSEKMVIAALHFYATGCLQRPVGVHLGITQSSASRAIHRVTDAINEKMCQDNIRFPMTIIERQAAKTRFILAQAPFNGALGAIDCMHIPIMAPNDGDNYLNMHGYHSINVQMICDPALKILNVNARHPGFRRNAYIWNASAARRVMSRAFDNGDQHGFLLGDTEYPLEPWLMTPLLTQESGEDTAEFRYNEALCKARTPVARLFGVLKSTWRCMSGQRVLNYNPLFAGRIVNACAVLHNLRLSNKELMPEDYMNLEIPRGNFDLAITAAAMPSATNLVLLNTAKRIRSRIVHEMFSS